MRRTYQSGQSSRHVLNESFWHRGNPRVTLVATVIAKLKLPGGERDVTLAFTSPT